MNSSPHSSQTNHEPALANLAWWKHWWRNLPTNRQDRFAMIGPLVAVVLFLFVMLSAFAYLRMEEMDREQGAIARDVEYAQQRLRLRLLERQEQLMRMARQVANAEIEAPEFAMQAENLINQYPELVAVTWVNQHRQVVAAQASPSAAESSLRYTGQLLTPAESGGTFDLAENFANLCTHPLWHMPTKGPPFRYTFRWSIFPVSAEW